MEKIGVAQNPKGKSQIMAISEWQVESNQLQCLIDYIN